MLGTCVLSTLQCSCFVRLLLSQLNISVHFANRLPYFMLQAISNFYIVCKLKLSTVILSSYTIFISKYPLEHTGLHVAQRGITHLPLCHSDHITLAEVTCFHKIHVVSLEFETRDNQISLDSRSALFTFI